MNTLSKQPEIVWFFGPSAAGKATLIRHLLGHRPPGLLMNLRLSGYELKPCHESLSCKGPDRTALVDLIPKLVADAANLAIFIKGQTVDLDTDKQIVLK